MKLNQHFKRLLDEVERLTFSESNTHLLLKYADEACSLGGNPETLGYRKLALSQIAQIKDAQIRPLLSNNLVAKEKRRRFYDSKNNLQLNLKECLI